MLTLSDDVKNKLEEIYQTMLRKYPDDIPNQTKCIIISPDMVRTVSLDGDFTQIQDGKELNGNYVIGTKYLKDNYYKNVPVIVCSGLSDNEIQRIYHTVTRLEQMKDAIMDSTFCLNFTSPDMGIMLGWLSEYITEKETASVYVNMEEKWKLGN